MWGKVKAMCVLQAKVEKDWTAMAVEEHDNYEWEAGATFDAYTAKQFLRKAAEGFSTAQCKVTHALMPNPVTNKPFQAHLVQEAPIKFHLKKRFTVVYKKTKMSGDTHLWKGQALLVWNNSVHQMLHNGKDPGQVLSHLDRDDVDLQDVVDALRRQGIKPDGGLLRHLRRGLSNDQ